MDRLQADFGLSVQPRRLRQDRLDWGLGPWEVVSIWDYFDYTIYSHRSRLPVLTLRRPCRVGGTREQSRTDLLDLIIYQPRGANVITRTDWLTFNLLYSTLSVRRVGTTMIIVEIPVISSLCLDPLWDLLASQTVRDEG